MHRIFSSVSTSEPTPLNYPGLAASCGASSLPPTLERLQLSNWTFTRLRDFKVNWSFTQNLSSDPLTIELESTNPAEIKWEILSNDIISKPKKNITGK